MRKIDLTIEEKDFYQENEWRFVPFLEGKPHVEFKINYDNEKKTLNEYAEKSKLGFSPVDVNYIIVKNESEVLSLFNFINNELDKKYPVDDLKMLCTKIVSLERLMPDL